MKITGKDIVLLIIQNDLMDVELCDELPIHDLFLTTEEAALKLGIGTNSLNDMANLNIVDYITICGKKYFDKNINLRQNK